MAESILGISKEEVRSLETSSFVKGESDIDALRTISSTLIQLFVDTPVIIFICLPLGYE